MMLFLLLDVYDLRLFDDNDDIDVEGIISTKGVDHPVGPAKTNSQMGFQWGALPRSLAGWWKIRGEHGGYLQGYLVVNYPRSSWLWVSSPQIFLWTTCPHKNPIEITRVGSPTKSIRG